MVSPERLHSRQWVLAGNEEQSLGNDASDNTKASPLQYHYPVARSVLTAATWFTLTAVILWCLVLPEATKWWTTIQTIQPTNATESRSRQMMNPLAKLPGNYQSLEEMNARHQRFPSIDQRVRVYMSNWYTPPCRPTNNNVDASFVQYNYLPDPTGKAPPLLVLQELVIPEDRMSSNDNGDVENDGADLSLVVADQRQYSHSGNNRTFLLDSQTAVTGAIIFYMSADAMRRCDQSACFDTVKYLFPSLHRIDMSVTGPTEAYTSTALHPKKGLFSYAGNALDAMDGNRNGVVPVILQFGDLEISRAYVPRTHLNETYPVTPVFKKFRMSLSRSELQRVITASCAEERQVPLTRTGDRHLQPSTCGNGISPQIPCARLSLTSILLLIHSALKLFQSSLTGVTMVCWTIFQE